MKLKNLLKNKRGMEIPFSWLFALIAGAIILLVAIGATTKLVSQSQQVSYSQSAEELGNMLNPIVNGITSAYATWIDFSRETRVYSYCFDTSSKSPVFGRQTIALAEESGFFNKWNTVGENISRYNKFIFSENIEQGKRLYLFSKPFYAGFRVDDIISMNAGKYCFAGAPQRVEESMKMLKIKNVNFSSTVDQCKKGEITVCFGQSPGGSKCNISVVGDCNDDSCSDTLGVFDRGYVLKAGKSLPYYGNLMYGAISASPEIYSCNVIRLGAKISELSKIYKDKIDIIKLKGCSSVVSGYLDQLIDSSAKLKTNPNAIYEIRAISLQMDAENEKTSICSIYPSE